MTELHIWEGLVFFLDEEDEEDIPKAGTTAREAGRVLDLLEPAATARRIRLREQ